MKNLIKILSLFLVLAIGFGACCKDDDGGIDGSEELTCVEEIFLNQIFTAKIDCEYHLINGGDTINIQIKNIVDNRAYGFQCSNTTGFSANINLEIDSNNTEFTWLGCDGIFLNNINNSILPTYILEDYYLRMIKMYPLSETADSLPQPLENYELILVMMKI